MSRPTQALCRTMTLPPPARLTSLLVVSDTLVGILMRARKRKRVAFESDMLFQGVHDHVIIWVLATSSG